MQVFDKNSALHQVIEWCLEEMRLATTDGKHRFRNVSLATWSGSCIGLRTVVLRAIDSQNHLYFYTDNRSPKVDQIRNTSQMTAMVYDNDLKIQIRVSGNGVVHHANQKSEEHWERVGGSGKKLYNTEKDPGHAIESPDQGWIFKERLDNRHFTVLELQSQCIEILKLDRDEHLRARFVRKNDQWEGTWLVP